MGGVGDRRGPRHTWAGKRNYPRSETLSNPADFTPPGPSKPLKRVPTLARNKDDRIAGRPGAGEGAPIWPA
eukprot:3983740-Pyramimonas_sp.AAC.1